VCICAKIYSENDVAAIDVNMGCPKEFSVKVQKHHFVTVTHIGAFRAHSSA